MCGVEEDRLISVGTLPLDGRLFLDDDDDDDGGRGEAMGPWLAAGWCSRGSSELWWLLVISVEGDPDPDICGGGSKDIASLSRECKSNVRSSLEAGFLAGRSTPTAIREGNSVAPVKGKGVERAIALSYLGGIVRCKMREGRTGPSNGMKIEPAYIPGTARRRGFPNTCTRTTRFCLQSGLGGRHAGGQWSMLWGLGAEG